MRKLMWKYPFTTGIIIGLGVLFAGAPLMYVLGQWYIFWLKP